VLGLEDSKKVVIVGIPGVGKTSLVTKIAEAALLSRQRGTPIYLVLR